MLSHLAMASGISGITTLVDQSPKPADVKAGWVAFGIFVALAVAVVLLAISLVKHLRRAETNAASGAFDEGDNGPEATPASHAGPTGPDRP